MIEEYRKCVGIVLFNKDKNIFAGSRIDFKSDHWQMPQGGVDEGEQYEAAAYRELEEETSVPRSKVRLISYTKDDLYYDLPEEIKNKIWDGKYKGQVQRWYLFEFIGDNCDIDIQSVKNPEFSSFKWSTQKQIVDEIVPFKKDIYIKIMSEFKKYL